MRKEPSKNRAEQNGDRGVYASGSPDTKEREKIMPFTPKTRQAHIKEMERMEQARKRWEEARRIYNTAKMEWNIAQEQHQETLDQLWAANEKERAAQEEDNA